MLGVSETLRDGDNVVDPLVRDADSWAVTVPDKLSVLEALPTLDKDSESDGDAVTVPFVGKTLGLRVLLKALLAVGVTESDTALDWVHEAVMLKSEVRLSREGVRLREADGDTLREGDVRPDGETL